MTQVEKPADVGYRCQLCGASLSADPGKVSPGSNAETKPDQFAKCPSCGQWFDPERIA